MKKLADLDYLSLLPPQPIARISHLGFFARAKMNGSITGKHVSPHKGSSVEFAEHREYSPGDDIRTLDWRVYGRNDRYVIKQFIEETNLRATLVVDCSGSMNYCGEAAAIGPDGKTKLSKFGYARHLASALAYTFINQQDAVGLVTFDTEIRGYIPARSRASQVRRIAQTLYQTQPGNETGAAGVLHDVAERIPSRGLVMIFSDLFDEPDQVAEALYHFSHRGHEVIVLHTMADEELTFPFKKFNHFEDLEILDNRIEIDPRSIKSQYLEQSEAICTDDRTGLRSDTGRLCAVQHPRVLRGSPLHLPGAPPVAQAGLITVRAFVASKLVGTHRQWGAR